METKKYANLNTFKTFLDNLKNLFVTKTELNEELNAKANKSHSHNISDISNLQTTLDEKTNQNAFSNVKVGNATISADIITDTLTLVAGNNITLTPDATNDKITISSTDTNTTYSAGTGISLSGTTFSNSGVRSIATGGSNGTISVNTNGTTANVAVKGLGSAAYTASSAYDAAGSANNALNSAKTYADNAAATAANKVKNDLLNNAGGAYDTLKELGDLIDDNTDAIDALEIVAADKANKSHTHSISDVTNLQTNLNNIQTSLDGKAASSHTHSISNISNLQSTLDGKSSTSHTHSAAGSSLGFVKSGGDVTISSGVITVNDDSHNHTIANVDNLQTTLDGKVPITRTVNGKALSSNISLTASDVGAAASSHTHSYLPLSGGNLTGGLGIGNKYELSPAYNYTNGCLIDIGVAKNYTMATIHIIGNSYNAAVSPINSLFQFYDYGDGGILQCSGVNLGLSLGAMTVYRYNNRLYAYIKQTSDYQTLGFTIITNKSGLSPTVSNTAAHTSEYTDLVTITPKNISLSDHTHKYAGSSSAGGSANSAIKATQDASGNVITSTYATKTELDNAKSNLQTSINGKANSSHTHTIANITNLQTTLDGKQSTINGGASTITTSNLTANRALISNGSGKVAVSDITNTELGYLDGAKSNLQTQIDGKAASSHGTHVTWATTAPKANGTATVGSVARVAREDHIHPLQTTVSGNAGTATTISKRVKITSSQSANSGKYIKFGTITLPNGYSGFMGYFIFNPTEGSSGANGLLHLYIRNGADNTTTSCTMKWLTLNDSKYEKTVFAVKVSNGVFDLYYQPINTWDTMEVIVISGDNHSTLALSNSGTFVNSITATYTSSLGGQVSYANSAGSATSATTATTASACSGNSATATKLSSAKTISLTGDVSGSTSFDGSGNVSITTTVADDSHNHIISNIDNLQTALDGKSATNHTHTADNLIQWANALFGTNNQGGVEFSYGSGSGKNVLTEISNMGQGFHTVYAIAGTTGNPETTESYRFFIHKTSTTIGWIYAFGADGSVYSNYLAGANTYKGWKTIHDAKRKALWTGGYYMTEGHTVTPSKKLSQCEHGWMLLWSDYDPDTNTVNNTDFCTTMIPNRNWASGTWNGAAYYCDIPRYTAGTATDSESRVIKVLNVYDNKLVGTANNSAAPRNDVVLRAVYEF